MFQLKNVLKNNSSMVQWLLKQTHYRLINRLGNNVSHLFVVKQLIGKEGNKFKRFGRLGPKEYFNWTGVSNPLKQHRGHTRSPTYVFFQNGLSSVYFRLFKQTLGTIFTTKNLKMYIQYTCWDSNQGPWEHESTTITTRPWVPPNISTFVYIFE